MKKDTKKKEGIFIPNFTLFLALIFFLTGALSAHFYRAMVKKCSAVTTGIITDEGRSSPSYDDVSGKYLSPHNGYVAWERIDVKTDGTFQRDHLLGPPYVGRLGDEVTICYDPDDPDEYYFAGCYHTSKALAQLLFVFCGLMIISSLFLFIYYNKPSSSK